MKRFAMRVTAWLLCVALLAVPVQLSPMTAEAAGENPVLAYVPIDDRPVVCDRVQYAATAAGFDVVFPPDKSWYQTHLDNQLVNADNPDTLYTDERQVGNGAAIMDWLDEMEADGCNYYIIHLDMMFSGGLVGSRFPDTHYDADGYLNISEQLAIAERLAALSENAENHVYFVDTVMRLASTSGFKGYEGAMYDAIRAYAKQARFELNPSNWVTTDYATACKVLVDPSDSIYYFYGVGKNWATLDNCGLSDEQIKLYHLARQRKMRLINYMMQYAPSSYYIIGVDDASPENTIQTNDINFIHSRMKAMNVGYSLFADTDSAAMMALARCAVDYHSDGVAPKVYVKYFGNRADDPADQYDIGTLRENVNSHVVCMGAEQVSSSSVAHDMQVLILTRIGAEDPDNTDLETSNDYSESTSEQKTEYANNVTALVNHVNQNLANNIPTIVMDCSSCYIQAYNDGVNNLQEALLQSGTDIGRLLGYSNWNTAGNTLGIGFGQGMSRYAYLHGDALKTAQASIAAAQSIVYSYVKDIAYVARHKGDGKTWMFKYKLFRDANVDISSTHPDIPLSIWYNVNNNMFSTMRGYDDDGRFTNPHRAYEFGNTERYLNNWMDWEMQQGDGNSATYSDSYTSIVNILQDDTIYTDLSNGARKTQGIGTIVLSNFRMPWYRIFEITFNIAVDLEDTYTYSSNLITVPVGISAEAFFEDVRIDKTLYESTSMYGETVGYTDYSGRSYTLTSPGPAVYTDTIASVSARRLDNTAVSTGDVVGTGFKVTVNGATYETVVKGDTTGDGESNSSDVRSVMTCVLGAVSYTAGQSAAADHDGNGKVTSTDARRILQDLV